MNPAMDRACFLDAGSLGGELDFTNLESAARAWDWHESTAAEEVGPRIAECEAVVTNKVVLDAAAFAQARHLRLVCVAATGVDNIDLDAAQRHGVGVCNAVGYATPAVIQHVFALLFALASRLPDYQRLVAAGGWQAATHFCRLDYPTTEMAGRTLGIVGHGTLGSRVAATARAFGMEVLVAARPGTSASPAGRVALPELLARADVVSLHCPLTATTHGLIDACALTRMRDHALLINTARGGLVDEAALAAALRAGKLGGAGIDVLATEPPADGNPLLAGDIPNLIVTPHCAWGTRAARQRLVEQVAANLQRFAQGQPQNTVVDPR